MNKELAEAVQSHNIVSFIYDGLARTVEPHLYGIHADTGNEILAAYQIEGPSHSSSRPGWRNFLASEIRNLTVSAEVFESTRPDYNPADPRFKIVFARA